MYTLVIDTHLNNVLIYLLKDGKTLKKEEVIDKKNNSEFMMPSVKKVIDGISLDEIIVVNGPGSFTGVRLGVTIAKTLAYTLNIPIKTITSLKAKAISNNSSRVAIDDNNGYYLGVFDDKFQEIEENKYVNRDFDISDYDLDYNFDVEKIYEYMKSVDAINHHAVNPVYIKKIGVEIDKESKS